MREKQRHDRLLREDVPQGVPPALRRRARLPVAVLPGFQVGPPLLVGNRAWKLTIANRPDIGGWRWDKGVGEKNDC